MRRLPSADYSQIKTEVYINDTPYPVFNYQYEKDKEFNLMSCVFSVSSDIMVNIGDHIKIVESVLIGGIWYSFEKFQGVVRQISETPTVKTVTAFDILLKLSETDYIGLIQGEVTKAPGVIGAFNLLVESMVKTKIKKIDGNIIEVETTYGFEEGYVYVIGSNFEIHYDMTDPDLKKRYPSFTDDPNLRIYINEIKDNKFICQNVPPTAKVGFLLLQPLSFTKRYSNIAFYLDFGIWKTEKGKSYYAVTFPDKRRLYFHPVSHICPFYGIVTNVLSHRGFIWEQREIRGTNIHHAVGQMEFPGGIDTRFQSVWASFFYYSKLKPVEEALEEIIKYPSGAIYYTDVNLLSTFITETGRGYDTLTPNLTDYIYEEKTYSPRQVWFFTFNRITQIDNTKFNAKEKVGDIYKQIPTKDFVDNYFEKIDLHYGIVLLRKPVDLLEYHGNYEFRTLQATGVTIPYFEIREREYLTKLDAINKIRELLPPNYYIYSVRDKIFGKFIRQKETPDIQDIIIQRKEKMETDVYTWIKKYGESKFAVNLLRKAEVITEELLDVYYTTISIGPNDERFKGVELRNGKLYAIYDLSEFNIIGPLTASINGRLITDIYALEGYSYVWNEQLGIKSFFVIKENERNVGIVIDFRAVPYQTVTIIKGKAKLILPYHEDGKVVTQWTKGERGWELRPDPNRFPFLHDFLEGENLVAEYACQLPRFEVREDKHLYIELRKGWYSEDELTYNNGSIYFAGYHGESRATKDSHRFDDGASNRWGVVEETPGYFYIPKKAGTVSKVIFRGNFKGWATYSGKILGVWVPFPVIPPIVRVHADAIINYGNFYCIGWDRNWKEVPGAFRTEVSRGDPDEVKFIAVKTVEYPRIAWTNDYYHWETDSEFFSVKDQWIDVFEIDVYGYVINFVLDLGFWNSRRMILTSQCPIHHLTDGNPLTYYQVQETRSIPSGTVIGIWKFPTLTEIQEIDITGGWFIPDPENPIRKYDIDMKLSIKYSETDDGPFLPITEETQNFSLSSGASMTFKIWEIKQLKAKRIALFVEEACMVEYAGTKYWVVSLIEFACYNEIIIEGQAKLIPTTWLVSEAKVGQDIINVKDHRSFPDVGNLYIDFDKKIKYKYYKMGENRFKLEPRLGEDHKVLTPVFLYPMTFDKTSPYFGDMYDPDHLLVKYGYKLLKKPEISKYLDTKEKLTYMCMYLLMEYIKNVEILTLEVVFRPDIYIGDTVKVGDKNYFVEKISVSNYGYSLTVGRYI